jgi:PiT family inorganic phosphate transporter
MPDFSLGLAIVLLLVLGAEFVNGWTDAPNAIATVVSTRCLSPFQAVCMASMLNLAGVLSGTAVAETIGKDIIDPSAVDLLTVGGAMVESFCGRRWLRAGAFQPASRMLWLPA